MPKPAEEDHKVSLRQHCVSCIIREQRQQRVVVIHKSSWDTTPLENTIKNNVDWAKVKRNADKTLLIYSTVDLRSGKTVTFNNRDHSEGTLAKAMLASASMPVFTPPVRLKRGQLHEELVDGGVTEFLPLRAVFRSGVKLDHIIAISTSPLTPRMVDSDFQDIVEILGRTVDLFGSEVGKNDYHGALEFNTILKMIENAEAAGVSRNRILKGIPPNVRTRLKDKRYVPITFIGPNKHIEMEPLSFEPAAMKKLMKQGFDAAKKVVPKIARSLTVWRRDWCTFDGDDRWPAVAALVETPNIEEPVASR